MNLQPSDRRFSLLAVSASAVAVFVFAVLAWHIHRHAPPSFDFAAMRWFQSHRTPFVFRLMTFVSWLGGTFVVVTITGLTALGFWLTGRFKPEGWVILGAMAGGLALMESMKWAFPRPRAEHRYDHLGSSFPSGHVFFALVMYGLLTHVLTQDAPPRRRTSFWILAVLLAAVVGFSRVAVGAHYPSDVLAGLAMGVPWLCGCLAILARTGRQADASPDERRARRTAAQASLKEVALFLPNLIKLTLRLARDPRVPRSRKLALVLLAAYLALPFDLIPDFIPVLGVADDVILVSLILGWVMKTVPADIVQAHWDGATDLSALLDRARGGLNALRARPKPAASAKSG